MDSFGYHQLGNGYAHLDSWDPTMPESPVRVVPPATAVTGDAETSATDPIGNGSAASTFAPAIESASIISVEKSLNKTDPASAKMSFSINKSAILSLKNCLKRIGETRKSAEGSRTTEPSSPDVSGDPACNGSAPGSSGTIPVARNSTPQERNGITNGFENGPRVPSASSSSTHIGMTRKRKMLRVEAVETARPPVVPESSPSDSSIMLRRFLSNLDEGLGDEDFGPCPYSTTLIEEFLEKAWLTYAICTKGDQLIFANPRFSYSFTATEIPEAVIPILSHRSAEAFSSAFLQPSEFRSKLKEIRRKEESSDTAEEEENKNAKELSPLPTLPNPWQSPSYYVASTEFAEAEGAEESVCDPACYSDGKAPADDEKKTISKKCSGTSRCNSSMSDPYSLSVGTSDGAVGKKETLEHGQKDQATQDSMPPLSSPAGVTVSVLSPEEAQELQWLCGSCGLILQEDSQLIEVLEKLKQTIFNLEDTLSSQPAKAESLLDKQKQLGSLLCKHMRAKYRMETGVHTVREN